MRPASTALVARAASSATAATARGWLQKGHGHGQSGQAETDAGDSSCHVGASYAATAAQIATKTSTSGTTAWW